MAKQCDVSQEDLAKVGGSSLMLFSKPYRFSLHI